MKCKYIILLIYLFGSCVNPGNDSVVNLERNVPISLFDLFSKVEIIELETIDEAFIKYISQIVCVDNIYYILDSKSMSVFIFDGNGRFKHKIANRGNGPEEYTNVVSFAVDPKSSQIFIVDPLKKELSIYSLSGQFKRKINLPDIHRASYGDIYIINRDLIAFASLSKEGRVIYYSLPEQRIVNQYLPEKHSFGYSTQDITNNGKYVRSFAKEIYELKESGPELNFVWDFGIENDESKLDFKVNSKEDQMKFWQMLNQSEILNYYLVNQLDNAQFNYAKLLYGGHYFNLFYDKQKQNYFLFDKFKEGVDLYPGYMTDDYMLGIATDLSDAELVLKNQILDKKEQMKLTQINVESNPVLVKYHFK